MTNYLSQRSQPRASAGQGSCQRNAGVYQIVKRLAATNISDYYCKALGYLGGALKLTPNTDTILAESARAAADFVREKTLAQLGDIPSTRRNTRATLLTTLRFSRMNSWGGRILLRAKRLKFSHKRSKL
jgi:hypothetical protein